MVIGLLTKIELNVVTLDRGSRLVPLGVGSQLAEHASIKLHAFARGHILNAEPLNIDALSFDDVEVLDERDVQVLKDIGSFALAGSFFAHMYNAIRNLEVGDLGVLAKVGPRGSNTRRLAWSSGCATVPRIITENWS